MTDKSRERMPFRRDSFSTTAAVGITRRCVVGSRVKSCAARANGNCHGLFRFFAFFPSRLNCPWLATHLASTPAFTLILQTAIFFLCIPRCKTETSRWYLTRTPLRLPLRFPKLPRFFEFAHAIGSPSDRFDDNYC